MTLVIITAGIDLSVGSVSALSGVLGVMMMAQAGLPVPVAILGGTLVGATCGLVNGLLVSVGGLNPFIATLGMLTVARGLTFSSPTPSPSSARRTPSDSWGRGSSGRYRYRFS